MQKVELTYKELHQQLMYNPWTGYFYRKIAKGQRFKIGSIAGTKMKQGYIRIWLNEKQYLSHRLAWFYVEGYWPENDIDHKDRIKHHNWWSNLREASANGNQINVGNQKNNTSGIKGVHWSKHNNKWKPTISVNNKPKYIGIYKNFDDAVCIRLAMEQCFGWDTWNNNSPAYQYVKENIQKLKG